MREFSARNIAILRNKFSAAHLQKDAWFVEDAPHVQEMKELLADGKNIYVWGKPGVGKTFAVSVLLQQFIEEEIEERKVHYKLLHMCDLGDEFRRSKRFDYEGDDPLIDAKLPYVLVLDDVGAEKPTEDMVNLLKRILTYRENAGKQTIFVSNFSKIDLMQRLNSANAVPETVEAINDRMKKNCQTIKFDGLSRRVN